MEGSDDAACILCLRERLQFWALFHSMDHDAVVASASRRLQYRHWRLLWLARHANQQIQLMRRQQETLR